MSEHLRLKALRAALNLSQGQLAKALGRKQGSISDIERGRNSVRGIAELLKLTFRVNPEWLREGEGEMFLAENAEPGSEGVPYYDVELSGAKGSFPLVKERPEYYINFKPFNDCTAYLPFYGDSMYPKYVNGDIIA
ncbi:MAG TPA: helix-turn-helix domain-containing protein, partial [Anseongella sp.]|nr:helix-turn-helix domain-containing protein [Anseongella sp.]